MIGYIIGITWPRLQRCSRIGVHAHYGEVEMPKKSVAHAAREKDLLAQASPVTRETADYTGCFGGDAFNNEHNCIS